RTPTWKAPHEAATLRKTKPKFLRSEWKDANPKQKGRTIVRPRKKMRRRYAEPKVISAGYGDARDFGWRLFDLLNYVFCLSGFQFRGVKYGVLALELCWFLRGSFLLHHLATAFEDAALLDH